MLLWGMWSLRAGFAHQPWYVLPDEDTQSFLELEGTAPEALLHVTRADIFSEGIFPPDHDAAVRDLETALRLDPQFSRAWMALARERILQGRLDEARAALETSDRLSPVYPSERLKSAALWTMLGDRDRSLRIARRIASLGPEQTGPVARELLRLGFDTDNVVEVVDFLGLETIDRLALLKVFHRERPGSATVLIDRLPPEDLEYAEVRQYVAPFLMNPLDPVLLGELWSISNPSLSLIDGRILVEDPGIEQPPFAGSFPMGWLNLKDSEATVSWEPMGSMLGGNAGGRIRFSLPRYVRREIQWTCYRFLADTGPAFEIEVEMTPSLARTSQLTFGGTMNPGGDLRGTVEQVIGERPLAMRLRIPDRTAPALVSLHLRWKPLVDPTAAQGDAIFIEGLEILSEDGQAVEGTPVRPETAPPDPAGIPEPVDDLPVLPAPGREDAQ